MTDKLKDKLHEKAEQEVEAVSYTHLDVYKRQTFKRGNEA